jgi:hypothetical protein
MGLDPKILISKNLICRSDSVCENYCVAIMRVWICGTQGQMSQDLARGLWMAVDCSLGGALVARRRLYTRSISQSVSGLSWNDQRTGIQVKSRHSAGGENVQVAQSTFALAGGVNDRPSIRSGPTSVSSIW